MTKSSVAESNRGLEERLSFFVLNQLFMTVRQYLGQIIWASTVAFCFFWFMKALGGYAGRQSDLKVLVDIVENFNITIAASISLAGVTSVLYYLERKSHKRTRRTLASHAAELEAMMDQRREGSELPPDGMTREDDL